MLLFSLNILGKIGLTMETIEEEDLILDEAVGSIINDWQLDQDD